MKFSSAQLINTIFIGIQIMLCAICHAHTTLGKMGKMLIVRDEGVFSLAERLILYAEFSNCSAIA